MMTAATAGYLAEQYVFNELMRRGVAIYKPLVHWGPNGLARLDDGQIIELEILSVGGAGGRDKAWFQILDFEPRPELFIFCITFEDDAVDECWVFPSAVFSAYATGLNSKHKIRDFKLDGGILKYGAPLREHLSWFLHRWPLITDFARYRRLGEIEDVAAAKEAFREQAVAQRRNSRKAKEDAAPNAKPGSTRRNVPAPAPEPEPEIDIPSWEMLAEDFPAPVGG